MIVMAHSVTFRRYQAADYNSVASLWTRVNRELAPVGMEKLFEQYISMTIDGELKLLEVFSEAKRNSFWVVESANEIVGSFDIESHSINDTELRRMYLDKGYRGLGIAQRMLDCAQAEARALGFTKMTVSTAQIQKAADRFYRKNGFRLIRTEVAIFPADRFADRFVCPQLGREMTKAISMIAALAISVVRTHADPDRQDERDRSASQQAEEAMERRSRVAEDLKIERRH